jgi:hypothetical protein
LATKVERFNDQRTGTELGAWARVFATHTSPRILGPAFIAVTAARLAVGSWHWSDLIVAGAYVVLHPFTEWNIHVFILHFKPRTILGRTVDLFVARKHRAHHLDPRDIRLTFIPTPTLVGLLLGGGAIIAFAFPTTGLKLTAGMTALALTLTYEWTHFLIHTPYRPRSRYYRCIWRAHRLHHYKNERYWFGITNHLADHTWRTFPERTAVETSPTCRVLTA